MRSRLYSIISIPVFAVLYCFTAIIVCFALIFATLKMRSPISFLSQFWAKTVFIILGKKFNVHGKEYIRTGEKYILVANHASLFDIVAIMSFYPGISWFGHERLLKVPLFGRILKMTDYVAFREPNYINTRRMIEQLVQNSKNQTVAIFPEGTRTLNGRISTFYRGFIYLYRTMDIKIMPVTLNGFYDLKPKNRAYINFGSKLDVIIHEPIKREVLEGKNDNEIIETVKGIIQSAYNRN